MAHCTECGAEIKDGMKFCTECGAAVPEIKSESAITPQNQNHQPQPQTEKEFQQEQVQPQQQMQQQVPQQPQPQPQPQQAYAPPQHTYAPPQAQPQPVYQQPVYAQPAPVYAQPQKEQAPGSDSPYGLISTWGYIGIMLLLCIPVIGFILMIVWACGGCKKLQKRNFCRAMLIVMAVMLVLSLILGFAIRGLIKTVINSVQEEIGITENVNEESDGGIGGFLGGLFGGTDTESGSQSSDSSGLLGFLGGLFGGTDTESGSQSSDSSGLSEILGGLFSGDLSGLMGEVDDINNEASKNSNGWPSDLPDYPDGTMDEVENYRTLITGSSAESMWSYIETLKNKGYEFQDFYQMGMSEADMKSINAWWGTNGKWYLSISYADGVVTVDHTTELPDMSGLFG